ncbi:SusC/RagA family TonB-linked outer membrane protein [Paramuribaculum intestinale]|uniref:SusC/RagA family TonB-linked outer membrane protein n=2 Tax=Paramuribaculum intestinale TaxID=2094151 RepID=UPI0025B736F7|nr:TonB-dependent receptor [Paramuribaculum intestinale]
MYHYLRTMSRKLTGLPALLLALCMLMLTAPAASASAVPAPDTATGTVLDQTGEPLPGASVMVVGTTLGGSTDIDGNFSIAGVKQGATLRVSFVGCKPADVKWEGQHLNVTLQDDGQTLDEVVVVGFGQQKKVNLTGAVSTVTGKEIAARPVNSVADALQGMAAGLDVLGAGAGGQLNATRNMNIRGAGTIGSGSSVTPLVLIDGMEGDLNDLNPDDVETISILKDAAASSIYGSRAAGGVILVKTKSGKEGKITVNYSDSFRWSRINDYPDMAPSWTWANVFNQASIAAGGGELIPAYKIDQMKQAVTDPTIPQLMTNANGTDWSFWNFGDLTSVGNTNWIDEHFGKTPFSQEHNISVTGGNEKYDFYFSGNLLSREGILVHGDDNSQRYTVNAKINVHLTPWLTFGYSNRWVRRQYDAPSALTVSTWQNVMRYWPNIPTHDPNGNPTLFSYIDAFENGGRYTTYKDQTDQQFSFRINPIEGLNINGEFNYRNWSKHDKRYYLQTGYYGPQGNYIENNPNDWPAGSPIGSRVYNYSQKGNYFNPNIYADYSHTFNKVHNFKIMAGFQSEWNHYEDFDAQNTGIMSGLPFLDTTSGDNKTLGGYSATWATAGWFGRLNYDLDGRYLVEGNIRYDGSSRFRAGKRWSWSPSFSLGWNIAREAFWENLTTVCNTLKLRYSWGKLGNQNTDNWYPTYPSMGYYPDSSGWLVGGKKPTYATAPGLISTSLTWEKNRTWDIGIDWGLFNNRLTGTADYYNRRTIDMVGPGEKLPGVLGASVPNVNNLSMTSKGWELTISWRDRIGDFSYGITANLYDHTTTIDEYPNENKALSTAYWPGKKLGEIWGFRTEGLAKTDEEMQQHFAKMEEAYKLAHDGQAPTYNNPQYILGTGWQAGDVMYKDIDGDGVISQGEFTADNSGDYVVIGNTTPRYCFGLNLDAQWKGFDVKVFFQGIGKRDYWVGNGNAMFFGASGISLWQALVFEPHLDYFRPADTTDPLGPNVNAYYPRVNQGGPNNTFSNDRYLQNAAYCRLKNVTIGYTLPQNLTRRFYVERLRVYVSGENLANITNFSKMGDPELIEAYNEYGAGFGKIYPLSRTFSCGLNVTF